MRARCGYAQHFSELKSEHLVAVQRCPGPELLMQLVTPTLGDLHDGSTKWLLLPLVRRRYRRPSQHLHATSWHGCQSNDSYVRRVRGQLHLHSLCVLARRSTIDRRRMACQLVDETMMSPVVYDAFVMRTLYFISGTGPGASSRVAHADPCTHMHPYPLQV